MVIFGGVVDTFGGEDSVVVVTTPLGAWQLIPIGCSPLVVVCCCGGGEVETVGGEDIVVVVTTPLGA